MPITRKNHPHQHSLSFLTLHRYDEVVTPYETCWQQDAGITNLLLQDLCVLSLNEHRKSSPPVSLPLCLSSVHRGLNTPFFSSRHFGNHSSRRSPITFVPFLLVTMVSSTGVIQFILTQLDPVSAKTANCLSIV